jgi:hypothetical protein
MCFVIPAPSVDAPTPSRGPAKNDCGAAARPPSNRSGSPAARVAAVIARLPRVLAAAGAVVVLAALWAIDPASSHAPFPPCPFRWLTGYLCPGCGGLRATHALLHGEVAAAFALNPLYVAALPFALAFAAWHAAAAFAVRAPPRMTPVAVYAFVAVQLCYGVARNLV